jgi:hypothetical protein
VPKLTGTAVGCYEMSDGYIGDPQV